MKTKQELAEWLRTSLSDTVRVTGVDMGEIFGGIATQDDVEAWLKDCGLDFEIVPSSTSLDWHFQRRSSKTAQ